MASWATDSEPIRAIRIIVKYIYIYIYICFFSFLFFVGGGGGGERYKSETWNQEAGVCPSSSLSD